jgi:chemotaxis protein MotB
MIKGAVLFESGSVDLNHESYPILDNIVQIVDHYSEYTVNIKGHTDDKSISTSRFPSNWELSAIRATTVLQYLIKKGIDPARLTATGYGDLFPLAPNNSVENRALNRRVEFELAKKPK